MFCQFYQVELILTSSERTPLYWKVIAEFYFFPLLIYHLCQVPFKQKFLFVRRVNVRAYVIHKSLWNSLCKWP